MVCLKWKHRNYTHKRLESVIDHEKLELQTQLSENFHETSKNENLQKKLKYKMLTLGLLWHVSLFVKTTAPLFVLRLNLFLFFQALITTSCLLICVVSSEAHTRCADTTISEADMHRKFLNPSITTNRHKRKAVLEEGQQDIIQSSSNLGSQEINRRKRVVAFRPLFVYRQQQIEKTRLRNDDGHYGSQEQQQQHSTHQQPTHQSSDSGTQEVHHHHHHHHHHHYPEGGVQRTYDSTFQ